MSKTEKREREQWVRHWTSEAKIEEIEGQNLNLVPADLTKLKEDPKIQWDQSLLLINQKKTAPESATNLGIFVTWESLTPGS